MRKYQPSDDDRTLVALMAARFPHEKICNHVVNKRTGKPINRKTLERHFKNELENAKVEMGNLAFRSWRSLIEKEHWPAVQLALANYNKINAETAAAVNVAVENKTIVIRGVPGSDSIDPRPVDVTPLNPKPALPWPENLGAQEAPREPPIIDSRDEDRVMPLYREVPEPVNGNHGMALPHRGTELDPEWLEAHPELLPWHKRPKRKKPYTGPLQWGRDKKGGGGSTPTGWMR
jgi:hypothetical protein